MSIDGLFVHHLKEELHSHLNGARINKIYQLSKHEIILVLRKERKNKKLIISTHPNYYRVNITDKDYFYPSEPPAFCMALRKHVEGGIIKDIEQFSTDRVLIFNIVHHNEMGDLELKKLYIELMGRYSNIILTNNENKIVDCLKRITPGNNDRSFFPNLTYTSPSSNNKVEPNNIDLELAEDEYVNKYIGFSKLPAREVFETKSFDFYKTTKPTLYQKEFYFNDLTTIKGERKYTDSLSELLDAFYYQKDEMDRIKQRTDNLGRFIEREIKKNRKKLKNLNLDLEKGLGYEKNKKAGDLLFSYIYMLEKGMKEVEVYDFEGNQVTIPLDIRLSPKENANKYYKKYGKQKKSIDILKEQISKTEEEVTYLENLNVMFKNSSTKDALEINEELIELGYLKRKQKRGKKKKGEPNYEKFISPDGIDIFVGKNNLQNEYLTFKKAGRFDVWMHAKDMPGSHVIIKTDEPSEETIRYAANLAAYFSKGRDSSSVPIDYTLVKNIKKIPGTYPGFVSISNQKTIYIDPSSDDI